MVVVALTGGIGSGKSTVASLLAERGAVIIDADVIAREVVAAGAPAFHEVVKRFGPGVVAGDGSLARAALAAVVFADEAARRDLNHIVHPAVHEAMLRRSADAAAADPDAIVVLAVPLLTEVGRDSYATAGVIVVDSPVERAITRLVVDRGFTEDDARARTAAQATREERKAIADVVIDNSGDFNHLALEVDRAWAWIQAVGHPR